MTHPSRFNYNSDYATTTNDATAKFTIIIPDNFTPVSGGTPYVVDQEFTIGNTAASMRFVVKSSRTDKCYPGTCYFYLPAKVHSQILGDIDTDLQACVYRSTPGKICVRIIPNYGGVFQYGDSYYDMGQTLTIAISTFLNPFNQ